MGHGWTVLLHGNVFGKILPAKGTLLPSLLSPPLKEAGCAPEPCAGWQRQGQSRRNQPLEALEWGFGGEGGAGGLGKLRECPSLPIIPVHILLVHPGAEHILQLQGGRLRVRSESTKMGILFFWASFCYGDSFAMGILSRNSFHTVLPLSPLGQQFHLPGVSM